MSEVISKIPDKLELPEEEELGDELVEAEVESPEFPNSASESLITAKVACRNSTGQCRNVEIKTCRNAEMPK